MATPPQTRFAQQLRTELARQQLSIRGLARRMNPEKPEQAKRSLARWLSGMQPSVQNRRAVAAALGVDAAMFEDDEEDEEAATALRAITALFADLVDRLVDAKLAARERGVVTVQFAAVAAVVIAVMLAAPAVAAAKPATVDGPALQCDARLDYIDLACFPLPGTVVCGMDSVLIGPDVVEWRFVCKRWPW